MILMFIKRGSEFIDETARVHGKDPDFCLLVGSGGRQAVDGMLAEGLARGSERTPYPRT